MRKHWLRSASTARARPRRKRERSPYSVSGPAGEGSQSRPASGRIRATSRARSPRDGPGAGGGPAAQPLADRGEGQPSLRGVGARPRGRDSLPLAPAEQLLGQPRLADACFAGHQSEAEPPVDGALPGLPELRPLGLPTDQGCRREGAVAPRGRDLRFGLDVADPLIGRNVSTLGSTASSRRISTLAEGLRARRLGRPRARGAAWASRTPSRRAS